ncbi:MAG: 30S ribosomal protein S12 methylthiotransferase RimO [Thermodesulfobacteriota bacterium]
MGPTARKVHFVSLGCPKNLVDGEVMQGMLVREGHELVLDPAQADVLVVNTCSFIDEAKEESIDAILELSRYKDDGRASRLIVTGCLAERYGTVLRQSMPEVDVFVGTGDFLELPKLLVADAPKPTYVGAQHVLPAADAPRLQSTPFYTSFLKIAEGCNRTCSFCIIPKIRGRQESRGIASLVEEARRLADGGVRELALIAQDLTSYGSDRDDGASLTRLLEALLEVDGIDWFRLLYMYPQHVTDELLRLVAREERICSYLDMPLQHGSDRMLRAMRRGGEGAGERLRELVARIRDRVPGVVLRSSFIVGFPGETEDDFAELLAFLEDCRFERVGVFRYSHEEGTAAWELDAQVPERVKEARRRRTMRLQARIARESNAALVGATVPVLVCGQLDNGRWYGRTQGQAADIDGVVLLRGAALEAGSIVPVRITRASTYDLEGSVCERSEASAAGLA